MNAVIKHEIPGRMRIHFKKPSFSFREADALLYYLESFECIDKATVYERTADAVIRYSGSRDEIIRIIREYSPDKTEMPEHFFESSARQMNAGYYEDIVKSILWHYGKKLFLPAPARTVLTCIKCLRYSCLCF